MPLIFCFLPNQNDSVPFKQKTKGQNYFPFAWLFLEFIFDFEDFYLSKLTRAKMFSVLLSINDLENMTFFFFHLFFVLNYIISFSLFSLMKKYPSIAIFIVIVIFVAFQLMIDGQVRKLWFSSSPHMYEKKNKKKSHYFC